jgi:hypothetical protein
MLFVYEKASSQKEKGESMKLCAHCGGQNRDQAQFCGHCGKPLSKQPSWGATSQPAGEIRKTLFGTKTYAVLAAIGWLTLFTPFVTLRACGVQQTYWGIDWIALQYREEREHVSHEETLRKEKVPPSTSLEATLEKLQAEQEEKSKGEIEELLKELYRAAPFFLRFLLSVDPVPEISYPFLVFVPGLAWLQWYRPVGWLCVAGLIFCLHTILNIYLHHHLLAHQAFPFGIVEIEPGWGLFAMVGLWGALYALNRLQSVQIGRSERWIQKILGPAFFLVLFCLVLLGKGALRTWKTGSVIEETKERASPSDRKLEEIPRKGEVEGASSPEASRETVRRESEEEREEAPRKIETGAESARRTLEEDWKVILKKMEMDTEAARRELERLGIPDSKDAFLDQVRKGNTVAVALFLATGMSPNMRWGWESSDSVLIMAASGGHTDVVRLLLAKGADVNAKKYRGQTALMEAAENGHTDIVKILLDKGADVNVRDGYGHTAISRAASGGHHDIMRLLEEVRDRRGKRESAR